MVKCHANNNGEEFRTTQHVDKLINAERLLVKQIMPQWHIMI